ncbi:hypothetical protein GCM10027046_23600 [Uliginosibacterium flavum]|uniref:STAS domain-containing protein n=1 Tax=Uliginosibacterium flavum TaxID=1396831 RepID=A0ABV2TMM3_9RHOO
MSFITLEAGPQMRIALNGDLSIAEAAEARDTLALALTTSESLDLDLGGLENVDVAGLQILLALAGEKHPVSLTNPSAALLNAVEFLQLDGLRGAFVRKGEGAHD